jgi:PAS domain S-box-containing protein
MKTGGAELDRRVLILTATRSDANVIRQLLDRARIASCRCPDAGALAAEIGCGAGAAILAEEALDADGITALMDVQARQPAWSDLPLILLAISGREPSPLMERLWAAAGAHVTVLERPMRSATLLAAVRTALQARRRQYEIRDELERRRQVEEALRESEARFREMADGLPLLVWVHDAEGLQQFVNETYCEFFGVTRQETMGRRWQMLLHPDEGTGYVDAFVAAVRARRPFHAETRVRRADGQWRWIESWGQPRFGLDESYLGHVGTSADVTDRKLAEQAAREKSEMLEEDDRRKDLFLATLGHELRNPLAVLDLELRLLADGTRDVAESLPRFASQVDQLTLLVNDLLEVSRVTRGKLVLRKARIDLAEVVRSAVDSVAEDIREQKHALVLDLPVGLAIEGDSLRLEQVVVNLLSNASKYTPEGGRIEVGLGADAYEAVLTVRDTGRGLKPDQIERVFEPFVQAAPMADGLGLGLALVRGLVELHGGTVKIESAGLGRGCLVTVRIPVGEIEAVPEAPAPPVIDALARPVRVLVVDDEKAYAESLTLLLDRLGAETAVAGTASEGIAQARSFRPEVMLVDIQLPDSTGYEVVKRVRAEAWAEGVRFLAITGFGNAESEHLAREAGFEVRLVKPVDPHALYEVMRSVAAGPPEVPHPERPRRPGRARPKSSGPTSQADGT